MPGITHHATHEQARHAGVKSLQGYRHDVGRVSEPLFVPTRRKPPGRPRRAARPGGYRLALSGVDAGDARLTSKQHLAARLARYPDARVECAPDAGVSSDEPNRIAACPPRLRSWPSLCFSRWSRVWCARTRPATRRFGRPTPRWWSPSWCCRRGSRCSPSGCVSRSTC